MSFDPRHAIFLVGPTAVGKSEIALELARRVEGEIISVDSMQVYRGLDLGTAKPSAMDCREIPHHLIDVVDLTCEFNVAAFVQMAGRAAGEIQRRGNVPIFCGGTGLYFNALLGGLGDTPPSDPAIRAALEKRSLPALLEELARTDPETLARIDQQNRRRVIRALEVVRLTGKPLSPQRAAWPPGLRRVSLTGLVRDPGDLHRRIAQRVQQMFAAGLVAETGRLMEAGLSTNRTASQAIGYRQVIEHLQGVCTLEDTIERVNIRTRQFAKRQMTWFRRQLPVRWRVLAKEARPEREADALASEFQGDSSRR